MRPIAENHTTITKKMFHEGMAAVADPKTKLTLRIATIIIVILFAAFGIYSAVTSGNPLMLVGECIFIIVIAAWVLYFMPRSNINTKYKIMSRNANGEPQRSVTFYEESFAVYAEGGKSITVSYKNVKEIKETANLFIFVCKDQPSVMIAKNGFTKGSIDIVRETINKIPKPKKHTLAEIAKGSYGQEE